MIGGAGLRRAATAIVIGLAVGIGLGLRSAAAPLADPPTAAARAQHLAAVAAAADDTMVRLSAMLTEALDHARQGAARTVAGDLLPAPELTAAADRLVAGAPMADAARRQLAALAGTAAAISPTTEVPSLSYAGPDLLLIAAQLRDSAEAATAFVERRHATEAIVGALADALAALDSDQPSVALESLEGVTAPLAVLQAWEDRPALLRYWMEVSGELVEAAREIASAAIDHDQAGIEAAAARYAAASAAARGADNALALSLTEAGSAVTSTPLRRLAVAAGEAVDLRVALQTLADQGS